MGKEGRIARIATVALTTLALGAETCAPLTALNPTPEPTPLQTPEAEDIAMAFVVSAIKGDKSLMRVLTDSIQGDDAATESFIDDVAKTLQGCDPFDVESARPIRVDSATWVSVTFNSACGARQTDGRAINQIRLQLTSSQEQAKVVAKGYVTVAGARP